MGGSLCIVYPLDYARTRLASDVGGGKAQFSGLLDCLKKTVASSGVGGLYNGIGVSVVGIIPYRGVYFGLFDTLSGYNPYQKDENNILRAASKFACAQSSAICAGYASYPFDTVRRRLQGCRGQRPPYRRCRDGPRPVLRDHRRLRQWQINDGWSVLVCDFSSLLLTAMRHGARPRVILDGEQTPNSFSSGVSE